MKLLCFVVITGMACAWAMMGAGGALGAEEPVMPPPNLAEIIDRADRGEPLGPEPLAVLDRFAKDHLMRVKCGTIEDALFSLAQLQVKALRGEEAVETLKKLAGAAKSDDVRSAAVYDLGKVYRVALNDTKNAADTFLKVTGRFEAMAKRDLIRMYEQASQVGKAVEFLQTAVAAAKDKGEKLALLRQLAELCKRADRNEDAIAAYKQIADEFTDKDIEEIRAGAAKRVRETFDKCITLQAEEKWRESQELMSQTRIWAGQLAAAGRLDEFQGGQEEFEKGWRRMNEEEKKRDEAKKKEKEKEKEKPKPPPPPDK